MKQNIFKLGLILCVFYLFHNTIFAQSFPKNEDHPRITLERTEIRVLHSDIVGQDYELNISLPYTYTKSDTTYPVIFVLDPYRDFLIMKGISGVLASSQIIQEVILVGIGYGAEGFNAFLNYAVGRLRDYTPVQDTIKEEWTRKAAENAGIHSINIISGGAPLFLEFIKKELFPFIESNYHIDTKERMLSGYSDGGLFGLYILFHDPDLFNKYLIGSPSIYYKDGISLEYESNYAKIHEDLKAEVFMSSGELEDGTTENVKKMANLLNSRNYKNLKLNTIIFENESHATCYPAFISRGLRELYKNDEGK